MPVPLAEGAAFGFLRGAEDGKLAVPRGLACLLRREVELGHFNRLFELVARACCIGGMGITAVEGAGELFGIFGRDGAGTGRPLQSVRGGQRVQQVSAGGMMGSTEQSPLGCMQPLQRAAEGGDVVAGCLAVFGLAFFGGSLARPFQRSGYRSRPKSFALSLSSQ